MKDHYHHGGAHIFVRALSGGEDYEVDRVGTELKSRGKGHMREAMKELLADADRQGVILLIVSGVGRDDGSGMTAAELVEWYTRLGFDSLGPWRRVDDQWTTRMQRVPRRLPSDA